VRFSKLSGAQLTPAIPSPVRQNVIRTKTRLNARPLALPENEDSNTEAACMEVAVIMNAELLYHAIQEERELAVRQAQLLAHALAPDAQKQRPDTGSSPRRSAIARLVQAVARGGNL
jgi:hypothetical protein